MPQTTEEHQRPTAHGEARGKAFIPDPWGPYVAVAGAAALLVLLYVAQGYSYNLFHSLAEGFSIVVAFGVFLVAWNSRGFARNDYLLFVGIAYAFVGAVDFLHLLAYRGMGVFHGFDTDLPTQLWLVGRFLETAALLIAPLLLGSRRFPLRSAVAGYSVLTGALLLSVLAIPVFPQAFVEGEGLTLFKKVSEYVICGLLLVALGLLLRKRDAFAPRVLRYLAAAILLKVAAELAFTLYNDPAGLSNIAGHYLKILSFFLIYKAIIETSLVRPYDLLFRDLKLREESLHRVLYQLEQLAEVSELAMSSLELRPLFDRILPRLLDFTQADAAAVLLSERERLIAHASHGLKTQDGHPFTVPIGEGFAGRIASTERPSHTRDALADRETTEQVLLESGLRTLLGAPLRARGRLLGVLLVGWHAVHPRDERLVRLLELLGDRVAQAIDNAQQYEEQRAIGEALQEAILVVPEAVPGIEFGHLYRSASKQAQVGGDFYDLFRLSHDKVGLLLGDVAGHGLEAAATASFLREIIRAYAMESTSPEVVLEKANRVFLRRYGLPMYATVVFAVLGMRSGRLDYCSAGHPPPMLRRQQGSVALLELTNLPVGVLDDISYRADWVTLQPGEQLLLYSDGVIEARRGSGVFGDERLRRAFRAVDARVQDVPDALFRLVDHYAQGKLLDDLAMLSVALQPIDPQLPAGEPLPAEVYTA